jgi:MOSC domain-containing protein YiiM
MSTSSISQARVVQVSVNPRGGVPKLATPSARLTINKVEGDHQREQRFHGGPTRAVCLYSLERLHALQDEGHPIEPGTTGENLLLSGLDWDEIVPGVRLQIGEATVEITSYTAPCFKIAASFVDGAFKRMSQKVNPGWSRVYGRIVQEGEVRPGDAVQVLAPTSEE